MCCSITPTATAAPDKAPASGAFYVDYRSTVPSAKAGAFPLAILHPQAKTDLGRLHRSGTVALAYLSVGEMASDAAYRTRAKGLPTLGRNEAWKSDIIDLRDTRWSDLLIDAVAKPAADKGFDGFFLDTPDSLIAAAKTGSPEALALRGALVDFVKRLKSTWPGKRVVLNRGFEVLPDLRGVADGVMAESVFSGFDPATGRCAPVAKEETEQLLKLLHGFKDSGFAVYVLDYADPTDERTAFATAEAIRREGFSAFVSTPDLMGASLAPWRDLPRRVLTYYNIDDDTRWPEDSFTSQQIQLPLEWLGYDTDFIPVGDRLPPAGEADTYAAIVIPEDFHVPAGDEKAFVDRLLAARARGTKLILFSGGDMLADESERERLFVALKTTGEGDVGATPKRFSVTAVKNGATGFESPLPEPGSTPLPDIVAPAGADRYVTCETVSASGAKSEITPVFTCEWGGMALQPFVFRTRPDYAKFWRVDPFAFLTASLGGRRVPATDVTTVDGLRVFISHIDGDGFANLTSARPDSFTGEIVRDRVLKHYPLPVSVSVIEAEVRGLAVGLDEKNTPRLEKAAREIFALPNIEVASHAYTHPFYWMKDDKTSGSYATENLKLKTPYEMNLDREIGGSIRYINERLAPKDKPVALFLWTGNCRPGPEALRLVRESGIESLNGGDTVISKLTPTITAAAARSVPWDDELQVRAPMQNENVYTHLFTGKVRGSFIRLLQTFEMTENPRRLKAANLYYHFYSADRTDSLKAVESVCDWAMRTPLHPRVESEYARSVRDAAGTVMFRDARGRTLVSGTGECRTLRLPVAAGAPDIAASSGITGYADKDGERYISLDGAPVRILALADSPKPHARIETSEGDLRSLVLEERRVAFRMRCWRPSPVTVAGLPADTEGRLVRGDKTSPVRSDAEGKVRFVAGNDERIELDFRP